MQNQLLFDTQLKTALIAINKFCFADFVVYPHVVTVHLYMQQTLGTRQVLHVTILNQNLIQSLLLIVTPISQTRLFINKS